MQRRVLFLCQANLCRSPLAEAVFQRHLALRGMSDKVRVSSAGISRSSQGQPADPRAVKLALQHGYQHIQQHRARPVQTSWFAQHDLILVMDQDNLRSALKRCPDEHHHKVHLLLNYAGLPPPHIVPDPYFGSAQGFQRVLSLCESSVDGALRRLLMDRTPVH